MSGSCFELGKLRLQGLDARFECGDYFAGSQPDDRDGMGRVPYFIKINCAQCLPVIRACAWQTKSLNGKDADVLCERVTA